MSLPVIGADWLAFNVALDRLVGREASANVWPYSEFKREIVEEFLGKLETEASRPR